jgi:hypothetical protein
LVISAHKAALGDYFTLKGNIPSVSPLPANQMMEKEEVKHFKSSEMIIH